MSRNLRVERFFRTSFSASLSHPIPIARALKIFQDRKPRYSPRERALGWHVHYDQYDADANFLRKNPKAVLEFQLCFYSDHLVERLSGKLASFLGKKRSERLSCSGPRNTNRPSGRWPIGWWNAIDPFRTSRGSPPNGIGDSRPFGSVGGHDSQQGVEDRVVGSQVAAYDRPAK